MKNELYAKYTGRGLTGLSNLGNTCFMNTCLQVLSHTYELHEFLDREEFKGRLAKKYESALILEWNELHKMLWKENCVISPGKFLQTTQKLSTLKNNEQFTGFAQNDMAEFLMFTLDCFHISLRRKVKMNIVGTPQNNQDALAVKCFEMIKKMYSDDYSEIWNMFYGVHVSQIVSMTTHEELSHTPEPFFMVNLPIPPDIKEPTLIQCFDAYVQGEELTGDNAWYNENTKKKEDVVKALQYWSLPSILSIDLKRFNERGRKNQKPVAFPLEDLDLTPYVIGYKKSSYVYDLYGVANHTGGTSGGHYFAYVKTADGGWYCFNDTNVTPIKDLSTLVSPKAYCLFYRKRG